MLTDEKIEELSIGKVWSKNGESLFEFARDIEAAVLAEQAKAGPVAWDDERADEIVSGLYRKFKEWSLRNFTADDVTWCEVKAEINRLISIHLHPATAPEGMVLVPREPTEAMLDAMRTGSRKDYPSDELCRVRFAALIAAAEKG